MVQPNRRLCGGFRRSGRAHQAGGWGTSPSLSTDEGIAMVTQVDVVQQHQREFAPALNDRLRNVVRRRSIRGRAPAAVGRCHARRSQSPLRASAQCRPRCIAGISLMFTPYTPAHRGYPAVDRAQRIETMGVGTVPLFRYPPGGSGRWSIRHFYDDRRCAGSPLHIAVRRFSRSRARFSFCPASSWYDALPAAIRHLERRAQPTQVLPFEL